MQKEFHKWIGNWSLSLWISVKRGKPGSEPFCISFTWAKSICSVYEIVQPRILICLLWCLLSKEGGCSHTGYPYKEQSNCATSVCKPYLGTCVECEIYGTSNPNIGDKKLTLNLTQEPQVIKLLRILSYQGDFDRAQWSFHNDVNTVTLTVIQISYRVEGWVVGHMDHLSSRKVCKVWICAIAVLQFWQLK